MTIPVAMIVTLGLCLAGGSLLGLIYFQALDLSARLIVAGGHIGAVAALTLGRLSLLGGGFALALLAGPAGILVMLGGILIGRAVILRRTRRAPQEAPR